MSADFSWLNRHVPYQIGTRDAEGWRTFQTPGDVCLGCSDPDSGRWVAVSECSVALAIYEEQRAGINQLYEEGLRALET